MRKDSATAQFPVISLLLSLATIFQLCLASLDIKSAYLQADGFFRTVYMYPPKGWASRSGLVWLIKKAVYALSESGILWQVTVEHWMNEEGRKNIPGLPQIFVRYKPNGSIALLNAKVVDDFLIAGSRQAILAFKAAISKRFKVGRFSMDTDLIFHRLHIHQERNGTIVINMREYLDKIIPIDISRPRRKNQTDKCTPLEVTAFKALAGSLNFLGHGVLPQASFAASYLQQHSARLLVETLVTANKVLAEIKSLDPCMKFISPSSLHNPSYLAFSDESTGMGSYGQTGYVSGIFLLAGDVQIYHVIDWLSSKQTRVSFSSIGAEILAAATSADRGSHMSETVGILNRSKPSLPFVLSIDSLGLYSTITTLREGSHYRLAMGPPRWFD